MAGRYTFGFANLCGVSYKGTGNLLFAPGTDALLVPVGNRVSVFDCRAHASYTLDCQARSDVDVLALSPDGRLLLVIDTGACERAGTCTVARTCARCAAAWAPGPLACTPGSLASHLPHVPPSLLSSSQTATP